MNPFNRRDTQLEEYKRAEQEVKNELSELSVIAQDILLDERYKRFTELLTKAEKDLIELFLESYKLNSPERHKKMDEYLIELGIYKNILHSVKDLSAPPKEQRISIVQGFRNKMQEILNNIK